MIVGDLGAQRDRRARTDEVPHLVTDRVLEATERLDISVLYASTVRPFDGATLRETVRSQDVILVEPYLEGTSAAEISKALQHRPHRLLSIGVPNAELRRYGTRHHHAAAHGLDIEGLRNRIQTFLE